MKRLAVLALVTAVLAAFVWADGPRAEPGVAERARQFRRDQALLEVLVEGGLRLAGENDPLQRAAECGQLAGDLAREIRTAGADHDADRVADLGLHLRAVLADGVAGNLTAARGTIPSGSPRERKVEDLRREVRRLEEALGSAPNALEADLRPALSALRQGRAEVERAIKSASQPRSSRNR